jgi:pyruvate dehydrogenase E2 component (dihydrolipoamide acetyltransferase)
MAIPITVPRLGWNMEQGTFAGWLRVDGACIRAGEPLFSLESDKSTEEIECLDPGMLHIPPDGPRVGDILAVGAVIGYLLREGEPAPQARGSTGSGSPQATHPAEFQRQARGRHDERSARPGRRPAASPRARRSASDLGIDWMAATGTGRTGRIRERDVRAAATGQVAEDTLLPLTTMRKTIAERMVLGHSATAPVTLTTTADATNLVNLRRQLKAAAATGDLVPSYTDLIIKLVAAALQTNPLLRARWSADGIIVSGVIDIGIAVDTARGLLVPVLRDVPALGLRQLAERSNALIERARQGKLSAEEMRGGTFTVTNLGAFGIDAFTPIINFPQRAVLGVGRIRRRPAVVGDRLEVRDEVTLSLTFDHRIVDGAPAARFLQTLGLLIESSEPALVP